MRHAAPYSLLEDIRATAVRIFAYMGGLAALAILAASLLRMPDSLAAFETSPQAEWTNVDRPHPAFELSMPELAASEPDYAILRRNADGARKDVLTWGEAGSSKPYVMVEVYRPGTMGEDFIDPPSEIAARIVKFRVSDCSAPIQNSPDRRRRATRHRRAKSRAAACLPKAISQTLGAVDVVSVSEA